MTLKSNYLHINILLINLHYQMKLIDYRHKSRSIGILDMLSDLKKLSMLSTQGIHLTSRLVIKSSTTSSYIGSKVVEIIDSQVIFYVFS